MKVIDVKNAVLGYGFSRDLADNDGLFYTALNLAVNEVNRLRPITERAVIVHEPLRAVVSYDDVTEKRPGEALSFESLARTVVFEVSGSGGVDITGATIDGNGRATWSINSGWRTFVAKSDAVGVIRLSFSGEYPYHVRNVAFYDVEFPPTARQAAGDVTEYDLSQIVEGFASVSLPILKDGIAYSDRDPRTHIVDGKVLRIPNAQVLRGTYEVTCEVYPPRYPNEDYDESKIPLDDDIAELVPLLVASYVWLDDEPEKAARYKNLYDLAKQDIKRRVTIAHCIDRKEWT